MPNPRKPTALKILQGTVQKSRMNPDEPRVEPRIPPKPQSLDAIAAERFDRLAAVLHAPRMIGETDGEMLGLLAQMLTEIDTMTEILRDGTTIVSETVYPQKDGKMVTRTMVRPHPLFSQRMALIKQARGLASEFGMTPSARARVAAGKAGEEGNPFDSLDDPSDD